MAFINSPISGMIIGDSLNRVMNKKRKFVNSINNKHHHQQKVKSIKSMKSTGFAKILTERRGPTQRTLFQKGKKFKQSFGREE